VSDKSYTFNFATNKYLDNITLTKLQYSFDSETKVSATTSAIESRFAIWGSIKFKELDVLDVFSIDQLAFSELAITVPFTLTIESGQQPTAVLSKLGFEPGNLRLDLGATKQRSKDTGTSLLKLLPFKLKSFLYSQNADQTLESLDYYGLGGLPGFSSSQLLDTFNYALAFDLDLGSMGGLVGSLSAFKFGILIGWKAGDPGIAFGVSMPEANGKLEIKIEGVLTISIEQFTLVYAKDADPKMLVLGMQNCYLEVFSKRLPPGENATFSIGLFAPTRARSRSAGSAPITRPTAATAAAVRAATTATATATARKTAKKTARKTVTGTAAARSSISITSASASASDRRPTTRRLISTVSSNS
jgi:large repetitive protein